MPKGAFIFHSASHARAPTSSRSSTAATASPTNAQSAAASAEKYQEAIALKTKHEQKTQELNAYDHNVQDAPGSALAEEQEKAQTEEQEEAV